jgi:lipopolysaccharide biosynthesis regulator YciM
MPFDSLTGLFWFLLPVAAASGYFVARRQERAANSKNVSSPLFAPDYFKGLNYLLNEQQDKAIEVFIKLLEVEPDTVETHFALANLFRRRGEVDRAIRIHQNLIARPALGNDDRQLALFELGIDYMRSGLLDRAEGLFKRLVDQNSRQVPALRALLDIYEQEKDWKECIAVALQIERYAREDLSVEVGQYFCEQAQTAFNDGNDRLAVELLSSALNKNPDCARASLMEASHSINKQRHQEALQCLKRIPNQDPEMIPEAIPYLVISYRAINREHELPGYLGTLSERFPTVNATLIIAELLAEQEGTDAAIDYIMEELRVQPSIRGLDKLIDYGLNRADTKTKQNLVILKAFTAKLLDSKPIYRCTRCGFEAKTIHWHCPSCKHWETVRPIHGIEGQ